MILFLADSRLYVRDKAGAVNEIESSFARQKIEDADRHDSHHKWKRANADENNPYASSNQVWGRQSSQRHGAYFRFQHVLTIDPHNLYYILTNDLVTGLFKYNLSDGYEQRLFHRNNLAFHGIDFSPEQERFVAGVLAPDGRVNLEMMDSEGVRGKTVTDGDSCDAYPAFGKKDKNHIFFQSSGIARNENGQVIALGPASIQRLNLQTGEMVELLSDDNYDYLLPRQDAQGQLYCIRRPYQKIWQRSPWGMLRDGLLFPFRFLSAVLSFLQVFTQIFEKQGMRRSGGPDVQPSAKGKYLSVLGSTIDVAKIEKASRAGKGLSLVPGSWELIRLEQGGKITVIERNVCSYDIDDQDHVVFTNGFRVRRTDNTNTQDVFEHKLIGDLRIAR